MKWYKCNTPEELKAFYKSIIPAIREKAKTLGFAIGAHGSLCRDLDLIAIPWVDEHATAGKLAKAIQQTATGGICNSSFQWEHKPCGRIATSLPVCWCYDNAPDGAGHIDLSVVLG